MNRGNVSIWCLNRCFQDVRMIWRYQQLMKFKTVPYSGANFLRKRNFLLELLWSRPEHRRRVADKKWPVTGSGYLFCYQRSQIAWIKLINIALVESDSPIKFDETKTFNDVINQWLELRTISLLVSSQELSISHIIEWVAATSSKFPEIILTSENSVL